MRDKIKKYFSEELDVKKPKFYGQGSYMMNTTVTPIDGEYDIDDGIYLEHLKDTDEAIGLPHQLFIAGLLRPQKAIPVRIL